MPDLFRDLDTGLESMLSTLSEEACTQVRGYLGELDAIDVLLRDARSSAGVTRVDEISLAPATRVRELRAEGRRICSAIGIVLGYEPRITPYGSVAGRPFDVG